jgi:hypothetical protein
MNVHMHPMFPARGTLHEQEAFIARYRERMARIRLMNEEAKRVKDQVRSKRILGTVQEFIPQVPKVCQAVNMNNTQCKFKATCGRFCKKHKVTAKDLDLFDD